MKKSTIEFSMSLFYALTTDNCIWCMEININAFVLAKLPGNTSKFLISCNKINVDTVLYFVNKLFFNYLKFIKTTVEYF